MKIFVASTGRCGTMFMADVFGQLTDIPSFHEPQPWCVGQVVEEVNNSVRYSRKVKEELELKARRIEEASFYGNYFSASQMFIKSYVKLVLKRFRNVYCIYLWRNPMEVLRSYAVKCRKQEAGWFLQSHWTQNLLRTERPLSFYENVLWQWFEVRERFYFYKEAFKKTYELDFGKMNDPEEWRKLFDEFGIRHKKFDALPEARKNESTARRKPTLRELERSWSEPAKMTKEMNESSSKPWPWFAESQCALKRAMVNRCEM